MQELRIKDLNQQLTQCMTLGKLLNLLGSELLKLHEQEKDFNMSIKKSPLLSISQNGTRD